VISCDAGSTDPGPYYLGAGYSFTDRNAVKRDLAIMIPAALEAGIPVMIGTAGGSGARPHVEETVAIIKEIAAEQKLKFKIDPMWGIPVSQLSAYLNLDADKMSAAIKQSKGIPTDSTTTGDKTSEFQDWVKAVKSAYKDINSDEVLKIAIKCSADAPYGRVKKVISELQDLDESRYYLVTNLKKNKDKED
jgi:biopolymer transport protein ExbD